MANLYTEQKETQSLNKEKEIGTVTLMVRPVLPGRTWDKGRGTLPGVCRPAGIRQAAAGRMPAWGDRQP